MKEIDKARIQALVAELTANSPKTRRENEQEQIRNQEIANLNKTVERFQKFSEEDRRAVSQQAQARRIYF